MLSTIKYIFAIVIFLIIVTSCGENFFSTTLDGEIPDSDPQMAIHAFITEGDSIVLASVSRSYDPLEDPPVNELLDSAEVEIFEDGNLLLKLENEDLEFKPINFFGLLPQGLNGQGKTYELVVRHPEFGEARAIQKMPVAVPLKSIEFRENLGVNEEGERRNGIKITLDDPAGIDNFYEVAVYTEFDSEPGRKYREYIETINPTVQEGYEGWNTGGSTLLIDGTTFDGETVSFDLLGSSIDTTVGRTLYVNWRCVSREMYRYSRTLYLVQDQDIEENPFASPVSVFSNIDGGLGVFGIRTQNLIKVN